MFIFQKSNLSGKAGIKCNSNNKSNYNYNYNVRSGCCNEQIKMYRDSLTRKASIQLKLRIVV